MVTLAVALTLLTLPRCGKQADPKQPALTLAATVPVKEAGKSAGGDLSRGEALQILKQHEGKLLQPNPYERLEFLTEPFSLPFLTASAGEMAGTEPVVLPTLDEYERAAFSRSSLDAQLKDTVTHQFASGLFFLALQKEQVIQLTELKNTELYLGAMGLAPPIVPATEAHYDRAAAPGIDVIWGQHDAYHRSASVQPIAWHYATVTGITGEGSTRTVEVKVQANLTASLVRLQELAKSVLREQRRDEASYVSACDGRMNDYLCMVLGYKIPPPRTRDIAFQRYDDGWRIVTDSGESLPNKKGAPSAAVESSTPAFRYLGTFQSDDTSMELYRNGRTQLVGRLLYPVLEADSPHCRLDGVYDSATGKIVVRGVIKYFDPFEKKEDDTEYVFVGTWHPELLTGELSSKSLLAKPAKRRLTLARRKDLDDIGGRITSLDEWNAANQ